MFSDSSCLVELMSYKVLCVRTLCILGWFEKQE